MSYIKHITCFFFCICCGSAFTQTFQRTYGGTGTDRGHSLILGSDGSYVFTGSTTTSGAGATDVYLGKVTTDGAMQWLKAFGGAGLDIGYSVALASDGGYLIAGSTTSFGAGGSDVYLLKTFSNGGLAWAATFGGAADDEASSVTLCTDGGFVITGYTKSYGAGGKDIYLIKTGSDGSLSWTSVIGTAADEEAYSVIQDQDGGYVMAGYTKGLGSGVEDAYIVKTDNAGTVSWTQVFGLGSADILYDILQRPDGTYFAVGGTKSVLCCSVGYDIYMIGLTGTGALSFDRTLGDVGDGDDEIAYSVVHVVNDSYVLTGYTKSFGSVLKNVFLTKVTISPGSTAVNWIKTIGGAGNEEGKSVIGLPSGAFTLAGVTSSYGGGGEEAYLVAASSAGVHACNSTDVVAIGASEIGMGNTSGSATASGATAGTGAGTAAAAGASVVYNACTNTVLPVELLRFWAVQEGNTIHLLWSTASESNNNHFTVERSVDGVIWNSVGTVQGAGNSSTQTNYDFIDFDRPVVTGSASIFYRLQQMDFDSQIEYFGPVAVQPLAQEGIALFPNPSDGRFVMTISESFVKNEGSILVLVRDIFGKEYYSKVIFKEPGVQNIAVDPDNNIPPGVYTVVASSNDQVYMKTIVIY